MRSCTSHFRRLAGATAIVAAVIAVAASSAPAGASSAAAPAACKASGLVTWLNTMGDGTAGSTYYTLQFTNLSGHNCTLEGYPGVSGVNLAGHRLGSAASRNPAHAARVITISSATNLNAVNSSAVAVLRITDVGNFPQATCRPVAAAGLRIYVPGERTATVIPFPFRACSRSGPIYLSVEAVAGDVRASG
jgi:Protein of unknown function (DUF4232)